MLQSVATIILLNLLEHQEKCYLHISKDYKVVYIFASSFQWDLLPGYCAQNCREIQKLIFTRKF